MNKTKKDKKKKVIYIYCSLCQANKNDHKIFSYSLFKSRRVMEKFKEFRLKLRKFCKFCQKHTFFLEMRK